ncbi:MAG: hypothetical protein ACI8S6_002778 [Myxococcota bacterium]|jgi:hypothetical protein
MEPLLDETLPDAMHCGGAGPQRGDDLNIGVRVVIGHQKDTTAGQGPNTLLTAPVDLSQQQASLFFGEVYDVRDGHGFSGVVPRRCPERNRCGRLYGKARTIPRIHPSLQQDQPPTTSRLLLLPGMATLFQCKLYYEQSWFRLR